MGIIRIIRAVKIYLIGILSILIKFPIEIVINTEAVSLSQNPKMREYAKKIQTFYVLLSIPLHYFSRYSFH